MSTVKIEFRHKNHDPELTSRGDPGWRGLTSTLSRSDADRVMRALDPALWTSRLVPVGRTTASSLPDVLRKMGAEADSELGVAARRVIAGGSELHDLEDGITLVRRYVYGAFEAHGHSPVGLFQRWDKVRLEHAKGCKSKATYTTQSTDLIAPITWLIRAEMERRVEYLNDHLLPSLGMVARARTLPVRQHLGSCAKCRRSATGFSLSVEVAWGDVIMIREYDAG